MSRSDQLLALLEKRVSNYFDPVDRQEILDFTKQYDIHLREDHLDFLTKYGNATLFKSGSGHISFEGFKRYYINEANESLDEDTPLGTIYFGCYHYDFLIIEQATGRLVDYGESYGFEQFYSNIKSFLFYSLCGICTIFDEFDQCWFSSKEEAEVYRKEHEKYRLADIEDYQYDYYFHNNTLMALKKGPSTYYTKHVGGVLNQFEEK